MDFGTGFITRNLMLPFLDFCFQFFNSYGLAIILLTLVVKFALWPLGAGSIRSMRKMQAVQPLLTQRTKDLQKQHKEDPQKLQQEQMALYKELGVNPLGGCLPLIAQLPILFALFATFQGSPFADQKYPLTIQVVPAAQQIQAKGETSVYTVYLDAKTHQLVRVRPNEVQLPVGQNFTFQVLQENGQPFTAKPGGREVQWKLTSGGEHVTVEGDRFTGRSEGTVAISAEVPGYAADKGFLFIEALGRTGLTSPSGFHWDIAVMIALFGITLVLSQEITYRNNPGITDQQKQIGKLTPVIVVGSFLFFPLPAGVLLYMVVSNCFQVLQTIILYREPLPEAIQQLQAELALANQPKPVLPFEKKRRKKK